MDPLTHTLVGAGLAGAGLRRVTALALPALVLGANLPDVDAVTYFADRNLSLGFRRGWTHGVVALAVLPALLAGTLWAFGRLRGLEGLARGRLVALCYLAVLTHPALDWLNTYGIRLLAPLEWRWFYGDSLYIVDPWVWLLAGAAVTIPLARTWSTIGLAAAVAVGAGWLIVSQDFVSTFVKSVWIVGVAGLVLLWWTARSGAARERVARACLGIALVYIVGMVAISDLTLRQAASWLRAEGMQAVPVMAGPVPADPFLRDVIAADSHRYYFLEVDWRAGGRVREAHPSIPLGPRDAVVEAALEAPQVRGLRTWMRFPAIEVESRESGYVVRISDVRFSRRRGGGLGYAVVNLSRDLEVQSAE